jgi:hydroxymethylpyrimidine pyrophosphatase-like HAD family hydrolase
LLVTTNQRLPSKKRSAITYLLTDIDDTITHKGRIHACAFKAMEDLDAIKETVIYIEDLPNDEPMFEYFPNSVGVANALASGQAFMQAFLYTKR